MDLSSSGHWLLQPDVLPYPVEIFETPVDLSNTISPSSSPGSPTHSRYPEPFHQGYHSQITSEPVQFRLCPLSMTPSDFDSDHSSSHYYSHLPPQSEPICIPALAPASADRARRTSDRRREQNRTAQRAFRERKEKHVQDLQAQFSALARKYVELMISYNELKTAYRKVHKAIELLTQEDLVWVGEEDSKVIGKKSGISDTLQKLLHTFLDDSTSAIGRNESSTEFSDLIHGT